MNLRELPNRRKARLDAPLRSLVRQDAPCPIFALTISDDLAKVVEDAVSID